MRILLALSPLVVAGCAAPAMHVLVHPAATKPEVIVKPALAEFIKAEKEPKIVLRVPVAQGQLTQEEQRASEKLNVVYNAIERELLKAGFTVRDRGLLTEVLRDNPKLDYKAIKEKIDTQLILEIVSFTAHDFSNPEYVRVPEGTSGRASRPFRLDGWQMNAKIVLVGTGEIGAIFTLYSAPENCHFVVKEGEGQRVRTASAEGVVNERASYYVISPEHSAAYFVREMIRRMGRP